MKQTSISDLVTRDDHCAQEIQQAEDSSGVFKGRHGSLSPTRSRKKLPITQPHSRALSFCCVFLPPFDHHSLRRTDFQRPQIPGGPKMAVFLYALTSSNINRFSKLFHYQNQKKTCNNTVTKDPTTPQVWRYTTL